MAVRLFEGKDHAASYLQYQVAPHELISKTMSYMEKRGTVLLAPYFTKVVGTDISQAMVERALAKSNPSNISYRPCPAEELPFTSGEVDLLTAMSAAHWFDRPRFLQEANRVLRPGGCLALLNYTMDMNLEYGDVSDVLNDICREVHSTLPCFPSSYLGPSSRKIYFDMFNSCSYKEWTECQQVRRTVSVSGFIGMVETFSSYQQLKQKDPSEAEHLSNRTMSKLLTAMKASSPDTEVTVIVNYFCVLACKPSSD
ncbi:LOW QUALITY PROTEIN: putative methyltransferase [Anableps anableps]